jgi:hypothetical protein
MSRTAPARATIVLAARPNHKDILIYRIFLVYTGAHLSHFVALLMRLWIKRQLDELGELNSVCSPRLHKLFRQSHSLRLWPDDASANGPRGTAVFAAFDPWDTCLRVVPHSFNYFRAAERQGLVNIRDSLAISRTLIDCCRHLQQRYHGHYSYFFDQPEIRPFMTGQLDDDSLLDAESVSGSGACADIFYASVPWPLRPRHHLVSRTQFQIAFKASRAGEPFTAVNDAIDYASWGPWIGASVAEICKIISHLKAGVPPPPSQAYVLPGRRMIIPFFSQGFQGLAVGFFTGIEDSHAELVRTELLQFGQTLADRWSLLRWKHFWESLRQQSEPKRLARSILQLVSPVAYLIVESGGTAEGYKLKDEETYWAGYRTLSPDEARMLAARPAEIKLNGTLFPGSSVTIKLLPEYPMLDQEFTKARIMMLLKSPLELSITIQKASLPLEELRETKAALDTRSSEGGRSLSVRRQLYVLNKVIKTYEAGSVVVTNNELLKYLRTKSETIPSGYQISSHADEIKKLLGPAATVERSRNSIHIRWTPA